jgi:hypothetical protein
MAFKFNKLHKVLVLIDVTRKFTRRARPSHRIFSRSYMDAVVCRSPAGAGSLPIQSVGLCLRRCPEPGPKSCSNLFRNLVRDKVRDKVFLF